MNFAKKSLKFAVGVSTLIISLFVFVACSQRTESLERATLKAWSTASAERRAAAVRLLTRSEENTDILTQCVDKIASLPDSGDVMVRDAVSLCLMGIKVKENS